MNLARLQHLADDKRRIGVADLAVVRVVGDEDGVAAVGAVQRAADRPDRGVGEAVVAEVVAAGDLAEAAAGLVDQLLAAVLRERQRAELLRRHQRPERIPCDGAAVRPVLEPEVLEGGVVAAALVRVEPLLERELSLPGADGVDIRLDGILGIDNRMDAAPHRVGVRVDLAHARGQRLGEVAVAGHRGEGDDVGAGDAVRDLVDLGVAEGPCLAHLPDERLPQRAVALRADVEDLRLRVQPLDVRRDFPEAGRGDAVLERHHVDAHRACA